MKKVIILIALSVSFWGCECVDSGTNISPLDSFSEYRYARLKAVNLDGSQEISPIYSID